MWDSKITIVLFLFCVFVCGSFFCRVAHSADPGIVPLCSAQEEISQRGGLLVADLDGDGLRDYILSTKTNDFNNGVATIAAYLNDGTEFWVQSDISLQMNGNAENYGLPGWMGPGVGVADIYGDGRVAVVHLSEENQVVIRDGASGEVVELLSVKPRISFIIRLCSALEILFRELLPSFGVKGKKRFVEYLFGQPSNWGHFQVLDLDGDGIDDEIVLQGDPYPFRWLVALDLKTGKRLWERCDYYGCRHNGFRAADIDEDGKDEIVGGNAIDDDGKNLVPWAYRDIPGHLDSLYIADVRPNMPGLEWVVTEEGASGYDDRTALLGASQAFFYHSYNGEEPQNAAIGDFDPDRQGLEIWCRSRFDTDQKPWVIDAYGKTVAEYRINDMKPEGWTNEGIETMVAINWDGSGREYIAAKERHVDGDVAIIDPMTGEFLQVFDESAARIFVADVEGDGREEIIVVNDEANEIRVYSNQEKIDHVVPSPWKRQHYTRQKMNYNYYSM